MISFGIWAINFIFSMAMVALHAYALKTAQDFFVEEHRHRVTLNATRYTAYALGLHWVEIILFGLLYWVIAEYGANIGTLDGAQTLEDYMYFSAATYTTLGFGDMIPHGELRVIAGTEALIGLIMISWSAVFAMKITKQ